MTDRGVKKVLIIGAVAVGGLVLWRLSKVTPTDIAKTAGGAGAAVGAGVVAAAGGVASGAVGAAGAAFGLPTPFETTEDPQVARWLIDRAGYFEASKWAGAGALVRALFMDASEGRPPPAGSAVARAFPSMANQTAAATQPSGWDYSSANLTFEQASSEQGWWPYTMQPLGGIPAGVS